MLPPKRSTRTTLSKVNEMQDQCITNIYSSPSVTGTSLRDNANQAISPLSNIQDNCTPSQKKTRRKLSTPQRLALEELSAHGLSPSLEARRTVAEENSLELKVVSAWFQNKRRPVNNKYNESTIIFHNVEPGKADQGTRRVLANMPGSINRQAFTFSKGKDITTEAIIGTPKHVRSSPSVSLPSKDSYAQVKIQTSPGLWDFLPSSPGPLSEACFSDDEPQGNITDSEAPVQRKKRHSLEWACENDERTTKRARKSGEHELQKRDRTSPISSVRVRHQRQRTDIKPRRPSPRTLSHIVPMPKPRSHSHGSLGYHESFGCCTEKDIMDVALALVQLKGGQVRQARKSI